MLEAPDGDYRKAWTRMMGQIQYGEALGYESVWLAEHHGSLYGTMPRLAIAAAAIAERTTTMRIGTAVTILPFDNPVRTAEDFAMVDVISNGRLDFGVGRAYQPLEFTNMGLASRQNHSRELFQESLDNVLGLWNNEKFSYQGKHWQLDEVECHPRPIQKPIPIHVAAISPETFGMVAAKNLNIIQAAKSPKSYEAFAAAADAYHEAGGFPVEILNEAGNLILGTPDFAAQRMAEVRNDMGQQEVILWMQVGGLDDKHVRDSMRLFAEEVMPRFKGQPPVVPSALRNIKVA